MCSAKSRALVSWVLCISKYSLHKEKVYCNVWYGVRYQDNNGIFYFNNLFSFIFRPMQKRMFFYSFEERSVLSWMFWFLYIVNMFFFFLPSTSYNHVLFQSTINNLPVLKVYIYIDQAYHPISVCVLNI